MASHEGFLKIDGIVGESTAAGHTNEVELLSYSWGLSQAGSLAFGGSGPGKVAWDDFHFVMRANKASYKLYLACVTGEQIQQIALTVRKDGTTQTYPMRAVMTGCQVVSFQAGGPGLANHDQEHVSVNFEKVEYLHTGEIAKGSLGGDPSGRK